MPSEARATEQVAAKELQVRPEHIPAALRRYAQWICWRYVDRGEGKRPDKQPVNPHNLHNAGVHWPNTWTNFEHAYRTYLACRSRGLRGIGFVLTATDPFVGVDLDHCVVDGKVAPEALAFVDHLASYTETSPSGQGLRILVASPGFAGNIRRQALEIYSHSRFVTLTGHHLAGTPTAIATLEAEVISALVPQEDTPKSPPAPPHSGVGPHDLDGIALWERIFEHDRFGAQHRRRFHGDTSLDGGDHSLTVIRLLNCLARWTGGDAAKMRATMLMSPLANEKWLSKRVDRDWLDYQIEDAKRYVRARW